jgi:subtilisin-like proprotein convertase family protein
MKVQPLIAWGLVAVVVSIITLLGMATPTPAIAMGISNRTVEQEQPAIGSSPTPGPELRFCSNTPIVPPDNNPTGATGTINFPDNVTITDLNVEISGTHSWVGDITMTISNGSTNVTFYDRPGVPNSTFGCSGDNFPFVIANDKGLNGSFENSCVDETPAFIPGGNYTNNNPLSAFDGQMTGGVWTLTIADLAGGDTGTVQQWCLDFNRTGTGPTPTPTHTPTITPTPLPPTATPTPIPQFPDINPNPGALDETHANPPQVSNDVLILENLGNGTLTWNITEAPAAKMENGACTPPTDIPWLSVDPANGSTPAGNGSAVTVTYNSASLANGTYNALLCLNSNDPDEPVVTVPVTLNVGVPTAVDLASFAAPLPVTNPFLIAGTGMLLLTGAILLFRRRS